MCSCKSLLGVRNINGQPGYSWGGEPASIRQPFPPELSEGDELLYDEPGRCGGLDCHCHEFRVVKHYGMHYLLCRNGSGTHRVKLQHTFVEQLAGLTTDARYWLLAGLYFAQQDSEREARADERAKWSLAFVEKRIKKQRRKGRVYVNIEQPAVFVNA